jgi:tetratricopeptide (TPR) repeat protein
VKNVLICCLGISFLTGSCSRAFGQDQQPYDFEKSTISSRATSCSDSEVDEKSVSVSANHATAEGRLFVKRGKIRQALQSYNRAIRICSAQAQFDLETKYSKALALKHLGILRAYLLELSAARKCYDEALATLKSVDERSSPPRFHILEAGIYERLACACLISHDLDGASEALSRSLRLYDDVISESESTDAVLGKAKALLDKVSVVPTLERPAACTDAIRFCDENLKRKFSSELLISKINALTSLAVLQASAGETASMEATRLTAVKACDDLRTSNSLAADSPILKGDLFNLVGRKTNAKADLAAAVKLYDEAVLVESIDAINKANAYLCKANALACLAILEEKQQDFTQAVRHNDRAIEACENASNCVQRDVHGANLRKTLMSSRSRLRRKLHES